MRFLCLGVFLTGDLWPLARSEAAFLALHEEICLADSSTELVQMSSGSEKPHKTGH